MLDIFRILLKNPLPRYLTILDGSSNIVLLCSNLEISVGNNAHPSIKTKHISIRFLSLTISIAVFISRFNRLYAFLSTFCDVSYFISIMLALETFILLLISTLSEIINQTSPCLAKVSTKLFKGTIKALELEYVITQIFIFTPR